MTRPLRAALTSPSLIEKVILLVLSGLIVPAIIFFASGEYERIQKSIEAQKARDVALLDAKTKFWNEISETILTYETLALDVSWFQTSTAENAEMHEAAFERYNERFVELLIRWRILISRAPAVASPEIADDLQAFLADVLTLQDTPIVRLNRLKAPPEQWAERHQQSEQMLTRANDLIASISDKMGIASTRP